MNKYPKEVSCKPKKAYPDINSANDAGRNQIFNSKFTLKLYIYKCDWCEQFHLTQNVTEYPVY